MTPEDDAPHARPPLAPPPRPRGDAASEAAAPAGADLAPPPAPVRPVPLAHTAAGLAGAALAVWLLPPVEAGFALGLWLLALWVLASDVATYTIPDGASAAIALLGLVRAGLLGPDPAALGWSALHGLGAFAAMGAVRLGHARLSGREGIGFGDVKLAGALGVWLDPLAQAATLQVAALAALALVGLAVLRGAPADRSAAVPFGAFLAPAAAAVHLAVTAVPDLLGGGA